MTEKICLLIFMNESDLFETAVPSKMILQIFGIKIIQFQLHFLMMISVHLNEINLQCEIIVHFAWFSICDSLNYSLFVRGSLE